MEWGCCVHSMKMPTTSTFVSLLGRCVELQSGMDTSLGVNPIRSMSLFVRLLCSCYPSLVDVWENVFPPFVLPALHTSKAWYSVVLHEFQFKSCYSHLTEYGIRMVNMRTFSKMWNDGQCMVVRIWAYHPEYPEWDGLVVQRRVGSETTLSLEWEGTVTTSIAYSYVKVRVAYFDFPDICSTCGIHLDGQRSHRYTVLDYWTRTIRVCEACARGTQVNAPVRRGVIICNQYSEVEKYRLCELVSTRIMRTRLLSM